MSLGVVLIREAEVWREGEGKGGRGEGVKGNMSSLQMGVGWV